ncbi:Nramp family divalent metal transporter [Pseudovibrio sp. Tun.PSC04-5.I4]|uniref:Nramp family divalent metal transporter n=1 Tax=Pseudovibrio sp. Tun.PSC04-5.I4 TaxID=1798213 RepID=UPI00088CDD42|nr:Nramp family divalent metal transporter [Pseudovibrio sp. Tun.PSC04-5.I4]SDQ19380.1 manganese transport protein [Pseudovibrio sp. Tun.PSC04-5.I4]
MTNTEAKTRPSPLEFSSSWGRKSKHASLEEVFRSIPVGTANSSQFRRFLAFAGPGYLVAVGYMDPGNWATSIAGGSTFGYTLLSIALLSNIMAIVLQSLCVRLAIGSGRDLAQACRDAFPNWVSAPLWLLAELAIIATDLAEVIGTAIGLNLVFGIPLEIGVIITALDVFLVLYLQNKGFRWIEAFIIALLGVISFCFVMQLALADPDWSGVILGFAPTVEIVTNPNMLYLALGIIGATVMPHNLYLHSGIVQTRAYGSSSEDRHQAIKFATYDSAIALTLALFINAAILILAAAVFYRTGNYGVEDLEVAYEMLTPLLGSDLAPIFFGVALLASGLSSTVTATMAGQIVMEGFIDLRIPAWLRRLITRGFAILPAVGVIFLLGSDQIGKLLILSQVVLSLQLPFAVVPLVMFTADKRKMGEFVSPRWLTVLAAIIAVVVIVLNVKLLYDLSGL